jgi:hypothetical protein
MLLLLHSYFTNAGSCWWGNFTSCCTLILLMLAVAGRDSFTRIQLLLHVYFTNARWETQPIWDNLTAFFIWLYLAVISGLSIAFRSGICAWPG